LNLVSHVARIESPPGFFKYSWRKSFISCMFWKEMVKDKEKNI
jgi:hypothetical protein